MSYQILYKPAFIRQYKKLSSEIQEDIKSTQILLEEDPQHPSLKTHKLKGNLQGFFSCRVNFSYRIIFQYEDTHTIVLLGVGNHDIYR